MDQKQGPQDTGSAAAPRPDTMPEKGMAQNPNPSANENIRGRPEGNEASQPKSGVGSEITDGEDA